MVCVIVSVLWQRRQKRRDAADNAHAQGSMTMRDRLRAESLKSLDSRLSHLYDPNKLKQCRLDHVKYVKDLGEGFFGKVFQGNVEPTHKSAGSSRKTSYLRRIPFRPELP